MGIFVVVVGEELIELFAGVVFLFCFSFPWVVAERVIQAFVVVMVFKVFFLPYSASDSL